MQHPGKGAGIAAMAATAILWSIAGLFIKMIDWNPIAIAGSRSLIAVIEPVFNPIWVDFAIGEAPGTGALTGGSIIILAVTAASIISARRKEAAAARG